MNLMKRWHSAQSESRGVYLALCLNTDDDDAEEDAPVLDLYTEVFENVMVDMEAMAPDLSEGNASSCETSWKRPPQCSNLNQDIQPLCSIQSMLGMQLPIVRIPYSHREMVKRELNEMLASGVIRPSTSPWASPIVLVEKKEGGVKFCVDFHKLNQGARFDAYPMPLVEEVFKSIGTSAVVTTLDLTSGYWQIPMDPMIRPPSPRHLASSNLNSCPLVFTVLRRHSRE